MTVKVVWLLASLSLSAVSGPVAAKDTAEIYGGGASSCGKWLAADQEDHYFYLQWVLGYVSAAGHYDVKGNLRDTDAEAMSAWIDSYCRQHPLELIATAADVLVRELAKPGK
jgi:hypothetical protein